jgi:predicted signal transduction protein with EAL and GGDEF domain
MQTIIAGTLFVCATFAGGMATLVDPWGTVSMLGFAVAFLAAAHQPSWTAWAVVFGNVVLIANQLLLNLAHLRRGFEKLPTVSDRPAGAARRRR